MFWWIRRTGLGVFAAPMSILFYFIVASDFHHMRDTQKQYDIHDAMELHHIHTLHEDHANATAAAYKQQQKDQVTLQLEEQKQQQEQQQEEQQLPQRPKPKRYREVGSGSKPVEATAAVANAVDQVAVDANGVYAKQQQQRRILSSTKNDPENRPPLNELIAENGTIISDVSWMLDFAIIGFGKCGTSTMMEWLHQHEDLQCIQEEVWALARGRPKGLVGRLYRELQPGSQYKRGYKCPADIADLRSLNYLRRYWPNAKLIIGLRHPVSWFQSLYNFRVQNLEHGLPEPNKLKGACTAGSKNTCTEKGNFGFDLMRMGKTNLPHPRPHTPLEDEILGHYRRSWYNATALPAVPHDVFVFEVSQFEDPEHEEQFRKDMQSFLGLETPLPPLVHNKPGKKHNETVQAERDLRKRNICDDEHKPVREELMRLARTNSQWLRETFLNLPTIYYSKSLSQALEKWMYDPCDEGKETTTSNQQNVTITATEMYNITPSLRSTRVVDSTIPVPGRSIRKKDVVQPLVVSSALPVNITTTNAVVKKIDDLEAYKEQQRRFLAERPPLDSLIHPQNHSVIGDVQWLLDFAIIGFGKCGTSTLMEWFGKHPQLQCIQEEVWALVFGQPHGLVKRLYNDLDADPKYKRGYKCPSDIGDSRVLNYYRRYFPKTKLFVGLRHPVSWFQSLYNFRVQNLDYLPPPNKLIGRCMGGMKNTCTEKGNYGFDLMRMGKKNYNGPAPMTEVEEQIVGRYRGARYNASEIPPIPNDVFLFDIAQLGDDNATRMDIFQKDVKSFLGLDVDLPPMVHNKPGKTLDAETQAEKDKLKVNICDEEFVPVRTELMRISRLNSIWIREVFLNLPGIYSSRQHLEEILLGWMDDPCTKEGVASIK